MTYFALIDPNWGEPKPVLSTIAESEEEAWIEAVQPGMDRPMLYSGASEYPLPRGTLGTREALERHKFFVAMIDIEIKEAPAS